MTGSFIKIDEQGLRKWKNLTLPNFTWLIYNPTIASNDYTQVHLAKESIKDSSKMIVVKVIPKDWAEDNKEVFERMISHIDTLSELRVTPKITYKDEKIPQIKSLSYIYLPIEMCNCGSLEYQVEETGKFEETKIRKVIKGVLPVLNKVHKKGYVLRQLDPSHILIHEDNERIKFKLIGMQYVVKAGEKKSLLLGNAYSAPEIEIEKECSVSCDIWSLGAILYFMAFGFPPSNFDTCFIQKLRAGKIVYPGRSKVSKELKDLIRKCLMYDPKQRITMDEILNHPFTLKEQISEPVFALIEKNIVYLELDPFELENKDLSKAIQDILDRRKKNNEFQVKVRDSLSPYTLFDCENKERPFGYETCSRLYTCKNNTSKRGGKFFCKVINTKKYRSVKKLEQLIDEVEVMLRLKDSAFTLKLIDYFIFNNELNLILEYCNEGTLKDHILELRHKKEELPLNELSLIAYNLAFGLNDMYKLKIMHRNIKPEKILLQKDSNRRIIGVKFVDYTIGNIDFTADNLKYLAPEIYELKSGMHKGNEVAIRYDEKADVWSYGVLLYFLLFPSTFTEDMNVVEEIIRNKGITSYLSYKPEYEEYVTLIKKCLSLEPDKRPTFSEILKKELFNRIFIKEVKELNPYTLTERISKVGRTEIYKAKKEKEVFAMKVVDVKDRKKMRKLIEQEIRILIKVCKSKNIVRLYDYFEFESKLYLVTQYYSGGDLQTFIFERERESKSISHKQQIFIAHELLIALNDMHSCNIIHRDISPKSIVITTDSERSTIKSLALCDCGLAKVLLNDEEDTNILVGKYETPELSSSLFVQRYNSMMDVWSFGMVLYFIMFGRDITNSTKHNCPTGEKEINFNWENDVKERPLLSKELYVIMRKCLKRRPTDRPTVAQLLKESIFT